MARTSRHFVVAFALACPVVMPPAVFQILFVGYWFWGNYMSPDIVPTLKKAWASTADVIESSDVARKF